jgi:hypothetical protein
LVIALAVVPAFSPFLGIAARLATAEPWMIAAVGAGLWCVNCAVIWYFHSLPEIKGQRSFGVSMLVWTLVFIPTFFITAALTGLVVQRLR